MTSTEKRRRHSREDILNTCAEGFVAVQHYEGWPVEHSNYPMGVSDEGKRKTPTLIVTLTTGQTFAVTARELRR